jgi:tRNA-(ms[2]io[6]A)-hydroxylase
MAVRRLPVLPASELPPEDEDRPPWQWAAVSTVGSFVLWLPLIFAANALGGAPGPLWGALHVAAFVIANLAAGAIVGRFGGAAGPREAGAGSLLAGAFAWLLAFAQTRPADALAWALVLLVVLGLAAGSGAAGGALGRRLRPQART